MGLTLYIEHEIIGGKTVVEKFEEVESFVNPPTPTLVVKFEDDEREDKKLNYGRVARGKAEI
jgi:hypothetical protein